MSLKEKLLALRKKLDKVSEIHPKESIDLNDKVERFISDYRTSLSGITESDITSLTNEMRNFIEKMAVWYELRYPNSAIKNMATGNNFDMEEAYSRENFIKLLSEEEKDYLRLPRYPMSVNITHSYLASYKLALSPKGHIEEVDFASVFGIVKLQNNVLIKSCARVGEIIGLKIEDAISLLESRGLKFTTEDSVICDILKHDKEVKMREEMLNAVMYRIIERGGAFYGPRRAFMFAKEFNRNIEIPMKYGIETLNYADRELIQEYAKAGGNPDIECYMGYFENAGNRADLETKSIREILIGSDNLTDEEFELYQKLTNTFANLRDNRIINEPNTYLNELRTWAEAFEVDYRKKVAKRRIARGLEKSMTRMKRL